MTVIRKKITINAPRATVWRYFEDPDLLAAWLMRNNFSGRLQEKFQFFAQPSDDWDGRVSCRLVEFVPPERLAFTWDANTIGGETLVTIALTEQGAGTLLELVHANFENATADIGPLVERHAAGWDDHLRVLATQLAEEVRGEQVAPEKTDWTRFDLHVAIAAEPREVLKAWSTIAGMEGFFVEMMRITGPDGSERREDAAAQPRDRYVWRWHNGRRLSGEYLRAESDNEVRFSFGDSKVSVMALPYQSGSLLRLRQYEIPDTEDARMHVHVNCRAAWVYFLTVLKTRLEHGIDARDKSRETGSSFSTYFNPESLQLRFR
jgi:uncharacterized protein YndB with AHSA1/START domain